MNVPAATTDATSPPEAPDDLVADTDEGERSPRSGLSRGRLIVLVAALIALGLALAVVVALVAGVLVVGGGPVSAQVPVVSCGGGGGLSERVRWDQSPVVTSSLRVPAGATAIRATSASRAARA